MKSYTTGIWELSGQNGKESKTGPYKASRPIKKNKNLTPQQISTNPLWSRQPPKKVNLQSGSQREAFCCGGQSHKKKKKKKKEGGFDAGWGGDVVSIPAVCSEAGVKHYPLRGWFGEWLHYVGLLCNILFTRFDSVPDCLQSWTCIICGLERVSKNLNTLD